MIPFLVLLKWLNFAHAVDLPPAALKLLQELPEKRLTLELVIERAMKVSDSYRSVKGQESTIDVPSLRASGLTDPRLSLQAGWQDDQREAQTAFSPTRNRGTLYKAGISKYFLTGTSLKFELSHSLGDMTIPSVGQFDVAETRGTFNLSQNLWKDAFGKASRSFDESADKMAEANRHGYALDQEKWFLDLADVYYYAWLSQAQYKSALQSLKRKERLVKILGLRYKRGTSEAPAVLQVDSAYKTTKVETDRAFQAMSDRWRALATVLKFPPEVEMIDPSLIPMTLDTPLKELETQCQGTSPSTNGAVEQMRLLSEAALLQYDAAQSKKNPSLQLIGAIGANAVEPTSSDSLSQFPKAKTPYLALGFEFSVPLGYSSENADLLTASLDKIRSETAYAISKDTLVTEWKNTCLDYLRLTKAKGFLEDAFESQTKRERLEEDRFRLGRASTFEVIQAGDDATASELTLRRNEIDLRMAAWKIRKLSGTLSKYVKTLEEKK